MPLWSLFLLQAALPPNPPAVTAPPACPTPPQYTYSDWDLTREERQFQGEWVVQFLHYSRTKTDECRGTSSTERKVEGPFRLWPAVPANRVADVNRQEGPTDGLSGVPLRSSTLPGNGAPGTAGPNPNLPKSKTSEVPANKQPAPSPFFPGFALFAGVLVASFFLRRRGSKVDPAPKYTGEPVDGPLVEQTTARTMDSIKPNTEWVPDSAEIAWLQAFFGIGEIGYGPRTKEAVKGFQEKHKIPVDAKRMIGPNTYRALCKEHISLVHEHWQKRAEGEWSPALERVMDSPLPLDLRAEMAKLNDAYAAYFETVEGRYQAILRRDETLVREYEKEIAAFKAAGVKTDDIPTLKEKYQPAIDALYTQAEKVKNNPDDGEYAKLLAMLDAADKGKWDEISGVHATFGGRWTAFWRSDSTESALGQQIADSLRSYTWLGSVRAEAALGPVSTTPNLSTSDPTTTPIRSTSDPFWDAIGPTPVITSSGGQKEFTPRFASWASQFNDRVRKHWAGRDTDYAGTAAKDLYATYQLTPSKVEQLWDAGRRNHVDPRLLLAILWQEGTGSFDTNPDNAGMFLGGNGPQPNWNKDLDAAFDGLVLAKLRLYPAAVQGGFKGDWVDYVNWYTPIDRVNSKTGKAGDSGVYAEDIFWGRAVQQTYTTIAKQLNPEDTGNPVKVFSEWMAAHPELFKPKYIKGDFYITQGETDGIFAAVHADYYDAEKYPNAFHKKNKNGQEVKEWFFFPAQPGYVWTLKTGQPSAAPAVSYSVPLLKQTAAAWKKSEMAPEGTEASKPPTVGNYGCAVTAAAMTLQYLGIQTDPNDIISRATANDAAASRKGEKNKSLSLASVWNLNWYQLAQEFSGVKVDADDYSDLEQIREWLANGPVILGGTVKDDPHFVVVTGFSGEGKQLADFTINDPGADRKTLADFQKAYPNFKWIRQFTR